ncbi:hypothetical protein HDK77DRAFT_499086 [Phyllosticta capitalensis]|uniref:uncharacterized protein n=1 Tax=Phyllosticta capitalensis TaxID=121624 RepID=UPI003130FE89
MQACFVYQIVAQHKPDHPEFLKAIGGSTKLDKFIIMWGGVITDYVDFEVIFAPPRGLSRDLLNLLDKWARYIFHCWLKAADASFIFEVVLQKKPDHPELIKAKLDNTKLNKFLVWRTMPLKMDVPEIGLVPIVSGSDVASAKRIKSTTRVDDEIGGEDLGEGKNQDACTQGVIRSLAP